MAQDSVDDERLGEVEAVLRAHGACFAFVHGSHAERSSTAASDLDVAAWQATTRKIYLDEQPRIVQARQDFVKARTRG